MKTIKGVILIAVSLMMISNILAETTLEYLGDVEEPESYRAFNSIAIYGNYMYKAAGYHTYQIYDISDADTPVLLKAMSNCTYDAENLWVEGDRLYISNDINCFEAFSLDDPENPEKISKYYPTDDDLYRVLYNNGYLYLLYRGNNTDKSGMLEIFDVSADTLNDDFTTHRVSSYQPETVAGQSMAFSSDGTKLYIAYWTYNGYKGVIKKIDISDPTNPTELHSIFVDDCPAKMTMYEETLILMRSPMFDGPAQLEAYDVSGEGINLTYGVQVSEGAPRDIFMCGNSILMSFIDEGIKNYSWNIDTEVFDAGPTLTGFNGGQMACFFTAEEQQSSLAKSTGTNLLKSHFGPM